MRANSRPADRGLCGVLLLDKPVGMSSNDALSAAKRLLGTRKAGHTGTLDPLASGLLPLCFGEATKFSQDLLEATKSYCARLSLGVSTTTGDAEGEVLEQREVAFDRDAFEQALPAFRGEISQVPPMHSALKRGGRPLYEYARAGQSVEREARAVRIDQLVCTASGLPGEPWADIDVTCSKGTYIRVLGEDIGAALQYGAHLAALRRTAVGRFSLRQAITLDMLENMSEAARAEALLPLDTLLLTFAAAQLDDELAQRFRQGQRLRLPDDFRFAPAQAPHAIDPAADPAADPTTKHIAESPAAPWPAESERIRVYDQASQLLGTARWQRGVLAPERLVALAGGA